MLHHLSFGVADLDRASAFYDAVLSALGYRRVWADAQGVGYGVEDGKDKFALKRYPAEAAPPGGGFHLAFAAPSREAVDRFHAAALAHGGQEAEPPRLWPEYGEHYYAAFVLDPEGYRIEAVTKALE